MTAVIKKLTAVDTGKSVISFSRLENVYAGGGVVKVIGRGAYENARRITNQQNICFVGGAVYRFKDNAVLRLCPFVLGFIAVVFIFGIIIVQ